MLLPWLWVGFGPPPPPFFSRWVGPFFHDGSPPSSRIAFESWTAEEGWGVGRGRPARGNDGPMFAPSFLPSFHPSAATGRPPPMHARSYYLSPGLHIPASACSLTDAMLTDTMLTPTMLTPTMLTYPPSQAPTTTPPRPTATTPSPTAPRRGCTTSRGWGRS